jgi:predicted nucleic acid-binding Zn ribbon protein
LAEPVEPEPAGEPRSRRDGLLLELGALVYELHRRGRRAPELLQKKAGELDALETAPGAPDPASTAGGACPACGEAAEPGQLVCLNCGERLELARERGSRTGILAALVAVAVIAAAALGFALSEVTSGSDGDDQAGAERASETGSPPEPRPAPADAKPEPPAETEATPREEETPKPTKRSLLLKWPAGLRAHTVVLVNTEDRASARRLAIEAARSGIEAGLLRGEDYDLGSGLWIVFAGRFDTRRGAARQADDLGGRFPGAYVLLVEPR